MNFFGTVKTVPYIRAIPQSFANANASSLCKGAFNRIILVLACHCEARSAVAIRNSYAPGRRDAVPYKVQTKNIGHCEEPKATWQSVTLFNNPPVCFADSPLCLKIFKGKFSNHQSSGGVCRGQDPLHVLINLFSYILYVYMKKDRHYCLSLFFMLAPPYLPGPSPDKYFWRW